MDKVMNLRFHDMRCILGAVSFSKKDCDSRGYLDVLREVLHFNQLRSFLLVTKF